MKDQIRIVVFGKGGVGKSTFSANLSAWFALQGKRVLHVGCDPKADSSHLLLPGGKRPRTLVESLSEHGVTGQPSAVINAGRHGIEAIEVGGPEPGIGCGGRGISRALEYMEKWDILGRGAYDVVLFDVLGDVVCGGFAAPLRQGFGDRVLIVASEDEMSFYAANNISRTIVRYADNGVALAGLVVNRRGPRGDRLDAGEFARRINTNILGILPFSRAIEPARKKRLTVVEEAPDDPFAAVVAEVAGTLASLDPAALPLPTPMEADAFYAFTTGDYGPGVRERADAPAPDPEPAATATPAAAAEPDPAPGDEEEPAGDLVGGAGTRQVFADLLGFDRPALTARNAAVQSVEHKLDGDLRLVLALDGLTPVRVIVRPADRPGAFVRTPRLSVAYSGGELTPPLQQLLKWTAKRLSRTTFERLVEVVRTDPESHGKEQAPQAAPHAWCVRAGGEALGRFRRLLTRSGSLELNAVESKTDGAIELRVEGPNLPETAVVLEPPERGHGFVRTPHFNAGYEGGKLTPAIEQAVRVAAESLGEHTLDAMHDWVRLDDASIELGKPGSAAVGQVRKTAPGWASFFAHEEFKRNIFHLFRLDVSHVSVQHCDGECEYATPMICNNEYNFYNYPWLSPQPQAEDRYVKSTDPGSHYTSHLDEMDVIKGGMEKISAMLDGVVEGLRDEQFIMVNNTCVPVVAGDDVDSLLAGVRSRCPVPILSMGSHIGDNPFLLFFDRLRKERGFARPPQDPRAFNLVGFPDTPDVAELLGVLDDAGVRVHRRPFPNVEVSLFDDYLAATLQVFYPQAHFQPLYDHLFAELPLTSLAPQAPYGFRRSARWLETVADALGRREELVAALTAVRTRHEPRWQALRRRARGRRLGLVLDEWSVARVIDPRQNHGIPVLPCLAEMGFGLEVLLLAPRERDAADLEALLVGVASGAPVHLRLFATPAELAVALRDSEAQAFYSDYFADHRLAEAGKAQFSLQHFLMGFGGAVETLERLLRLVELPFFQRYGAYLRTDARPGGGDA